MTLNDFQCLEDSYKSIDPFLNRVPKPDYNCSDFAAEVWEYLTGKDVTRLVKNWSIESRSRLRQLDEPSDPCLIIMYQARITPHVGIYIRGRVLHLSDYGVEYVSLQLAVRGFRNWRFYKPK